MRPVGENKNRGQRSTVCSRPGGIAGFGLECPGTADFTGRKYPCGEILSVERCKYTRNCSTKNTKKNLKDTKKIILIHEGHEEYEKTIKTWCSSCPSWMEKRKTNSFHEGDGKKTLRTQSIYNND